jgi:hypothetical protein
MDVLTLSEDPKTARAELSELRANLNRARLPEDRLLAKCHRQMARGRRILDLSRAVIDAGFDEKGFPKLAVAHADQTEVWMQRRYDGELHFARHQNYRLTSRYRPAHRLERLNDTIIIQGGAAPAWELRSGGAVSGRAIVPTIPARLRPRVLTPYLLLWEADWVEAPVDPFLLYPLGNGLCAVVAAWDLTPLERMVIGATRRG